MYNNVEREEMEKLEMKKLKLNQGEIIAAGIAIILLCVVYGLGLYDQMDNAAYYATRIVGAVIVLYALFTLFVAYQRKQIAKYEFGSEEHDKKLRRLMWIDKRPYNQTLYKYELVKSELERGEAAKAKADLAAMKYEKISKNRVLDRLYCCIYITCLYELGEMEEAEKWYKEKVEEYLNSSDLPEYIKHLYAGERFYYQNRYEASRKELQSLLSLSPAKGALVRSLFYLAQMDYQQGRCESAREQYEKIVSMQKHGWMVEEAKRILAVMEYDEQITD